MLRYATTNQRAWLGMQRDEAPVEWSGKSTEGEVLRPFAVSHTNRSERERKGGDMGGGGGR